MFVAASVDGWTVFWVSVLPLTAIVLLSGVTYLARRWYLRTRGPVNSANELLASFRQLQKEGELTKEEYLKIRQRLEPAVRKEWQGKSAETPAGETPSANASDGADLDPAADS